MEACAAVEENVFAQVHAQLEALEARLCSPEARKMTHSEIETLIEVQGRELLRQLFQSHLDLRSPGSVEGVAVTGRDGLERTEGRGRERGLKTVFGRVEVRRTGYSAKEAPSLFPLDADLNLPPELYSFGVQKRVAADAAKVSVDDVVGRMKQTTGAPVPKRQAEELVAQAAQDFDVFYALSARGATPEGTSDLLVLSFDQKGVVLLARDLREATRKAAEQRPPRLETRYSKGEPHGRKRMATVAAVYTIAAYLRTPEQIIAGLRHVRDASAAARPRPEHKRVWARLDKTLAQVVAAGFAEASARDPERRKKWLVLVDGAPDLEALVRAEARKLGVAITVVLDVIHALEYVWDASLAFFAEDDSDRETWVLDRLRRILEGGVSDVVAGMTRSATLRELPKKLRRPVDRAAKYLLKRTDMMRYDELLAIGAPIATGVIEGACRHLICDRLDITGARWTLEQAEAVLRLRALASSGDFDAYWTFHERQEFERKCLSG